MTEKTPDLVAALAAVPIFAGLSRRQVGKLLDKSKVIEHKDGQEIAKEGEGALALHLILDGSAKVSVHGDHVRDLGKGDYFGEISLIDGRRRSASVHASGDLTTLVVPHLAFHNLLREEPEFALELLKLLCARIRESESA